MLKKISNELLELALRELQVAIEKNESKVEITLSQRFPNNTSNIKRFCNMLELQDVTDSLIEKFPNYNITSVVKSKGLLLVWILELRKK